MKKIKLLTIMLTVMILAACGGTTVESTKKTETDATGSQSGTSDPTNITEPIGATEPKVESRVYKTGDRVIINENYAITIVGVTQTDERNQYAEKEVAQVVIIDYIYENLSSSDEDIYISEMNFKFVDDAGNMLDTYPISGQFNSAYTPVGAKSLSSMVVGTVVESNKLKVLFYDNYFESESLAEFDLEIGDKVDYTLDGTMPSYTNTYKMGDIIEVSTTDGKYTLSIDKVEKTDERNQFAETSPADVYVITYTYSNVSLTENLYVSESDFGLVDSSGTMGYSYPGSTDYYPNETIKGAKCTAEMVIASHTSGDTLILTYRNNLFAEAADLFILIDSIN